MDGSAEVQVAQSRPCPEAHRVRRVLSLRHLYADCGYSIGMKDTRPWIGYAAAATSPLICTLAGLAMRPRFDIVNVAMVYLLAVVIVALLFSRGAAILGATLCVAAFDFMFVPPEGTFSVGDTQYLFTFAIMLGVALVISRLMETGRREAARHASLSLEAETERIRSALLASISHDLRTPLAVLTGASSTLAEGSGRLSGEEREALAQSIYAQARDLSEQVDKVLQMTRLEAQAIVPDLDWASLAEIAGSVLARLHDRLAGHRLLVEIPSDLPLVRVDATLIEQAMGNLLDNAARHTPPGTVVFLRAKQVGPEIVVSVEDGGPGLDGKDMEEVFAKFHRGASEASGGGVGLGLAICRAIVRLHGGRIWAEPNIGGGLVVRFVLPVEAAPHPPIEAEAT
jgi:two-component system sensor histidine kinase KdpD